jgi:hypothetical protein
MLRQSTDGDSGVVLVLVTTLSCLAVMYWRVTLLVLAAIALTSLVCGVLVLADAIG